MNKTILAVDIGNTLTHIAVIKGVKVLSKNFIETMDSKREYGLRLQQIFSKIQRDHKRIHGIIICSVVPQGLKITVTSVKIRFALKPWVVGKDINVPIKNRYHFPRQVGQDRLVAAYAAVRLYGFPSIIIDFGTAITFDIVSQRGEYLGGLIVPGIRLSAESLFNKTALLPKVTMQKPKTLIGRDTKGSILSGLYYGYGTLCQGLIKLINQDMRRYHRFKRIVIMTGGYTELMKSFISPIQRIIDKDLVLKGLSLLYDRAQK